MVDYTINDDLYQILRCVELKDRIDLEEVAYPVVSVKRENEGE